MVRGGYGIFYARTTAIILGTAHSGNGINTTGVTLSGSQLAALGLAYPNILSAPPTVGAVPNPDLFLFPKDYTQPYVEQARFGFEREILPNTSLSITYLFFRGVHLTRTRDINLFAPVPTTATDVTGQTFTVLRFPGASFTATAPVRPFTRYNRINLFESSANSRYNGSPCRRRALRAGFSVYGLLHLFEGQRRQTDQTASFRRQ